MQHIDTTAQLLALAQQGSDRTGSPAQCGCRLSNFAGWDSMPDSRWPAQQMEQIASLRTPDAPEPTFTEYHPHGTRYDSPDAPIALTYFPTNRATVWRCRACGLQMLRYTEFGGYYIDHRARVLDASLVQDAPAPAV